VSAIIASIYNVDPTSDVDLSGLVAMTTVPSPGDTIRRVDGTRIRVIRCEFQELPLSLDDADNNLPDVYLGVRLENAHS